MVLGFLNRQAIRNTDSTVAEARREVIELRESLWRLEQRLGKQGLLVQALLGLLRDKHGVTDEEVLERVRQAETAKVNAGPKMCPQCQRAFGEKHNHCIYCGAQRRVESPLELA
jgi:hypothetical protein